jgi:hypothetical protein
VTPGLSANISLDVSRPVFVRIDILGNNTTSYVALEMKSSANGPWTLVPDSWLEADVPGPQSQRAALQDRVSSAPHSA